jgi:hypothetical protein
MKGCRGGSGAEIGRGWAGAPMNAGGWFAPGPSGIGSAGTAATAPEDPASAITAAITAAGAIREVRSEEAELVRRSLKRPSHARRPATVAQIKNLPRPRRAQTRLALCRLADTGAALRGRG